jgi:hypothetical protein
MPDRYDQALLNMLNVGFFRARKLTTSYAMFLSSFCLMICCVGCFGMRGLVRSLLNQVLGVKPTERCVNIQG